MERGQFCPKKKKRKKKKIALTKHLTSTSQRISKQNRMFCGKQSPALNLLGFD